jgi:uncharacterized membrane protein
MKSDPSNNPNGKSNFHDFIYHPISGDLKVIILLIVFSLIGIYVPISIPFVRIIFAIPLALFIPGYLIMLVFFPKRGDIGEIERLILSIGLSVAIIPLIGLLLNFSPWGIRLDPLVALMIIFILLMIIFARYRQISIPREDQYSLSCDPIAGIFKKDADSGELSSGDRIRSIILITGICCAIGITAFIVTIPKHDESFTEFYLLGPSGMAFDYPTDIIPGTIYPLQIGVANHEFQNITYTVEIWAIPEQLISGDTKPAGLPILRLDQIRMTLGRNETRIIPYNLTINAMGYNRIDFLLFNESYTREKSVGLDQINASYRDLHVWINTTNQNHV